MAPQTNFEWARKMKISIVGKFQAMLFALLLCAANLAVAQVAKVTFLSGVATATAVGSSAAERQLKQGDAVNQGETVSTGRNSNAVLTFSDGHIAGLSPSTTMVITAYAYDAAKPSVSRVLLSLVAGGMRAITGLIGRATPAQVSYRVGTSTVGIRGTTVDLATADGNVVVDVVLGAISFTFNNQTVTISAGNSGLAANGAFTTDTQAAILAALTGNPRLKAALAGVDNAVLKNAIDSSASGSGTGGTGGASGTPGGTPGGGTSGGGGGGSGTPASPN